MKVYLAISFASAVAPKVSNASIAVPSLVILVADEETSFPSASINFKVIVLPDLAHA